MVVCGVDDGYFPLSYKGGKGKTILLSSFFQSFNLIDIDFDYITVDGEDGNTIFKSITKGCNVTFLDGVIYGGFNYITPDKNYIVFYSKMPNVTSIDRALMKHFPLKRGKIIPFLQNLTALPTRQGTVYINTDLELRLCKELIERYQLFTSTPIPIKVSHELASSLSKFIFKRRTM
ncbi:hypothetical protein SUSAZ_03250 [Sulfolobus acidocaldarius SUSAZ]|nr:hypothetical protein SUSAZ_03250 [Sulfolobus acidocaldarius SUSAZ]